MKPMNDLPCLLCGVMEVIITCRMTGVGEREVQ